MSRPLDFISLRDPLTNRTTSLVIYGRRPDQNQLLGISGGLSHGSLVEPNSHQDADKLIYWLQDWKTRNSNKNQNP
jgi:hypothetical protein